MQSFQVDASTSTITSGRKCEKRELELGAAPFPELQNPKCRPRGGQRSESRSRREADLCHLKELRVDESVNEPLQQWEKGRKKKSDKVQLTFLCTSSPSLIFTFRLAWERGLRTEVEYHSNSSLLAFYACTVERCKCRTFPRRAFQNRRLRARLHYRGEILPTAIVSLSHSWCFSSRGIFVQEFKVRTFPVLSDEKKKKTGMLAFPHNNRTCRLRARALELPTHPASSSL